MLRRRRDSVAVNAGRLLAHDVRIVARRHVGNQVMSGLATDIAEMTFVTRFDRSGHRFTG